MTRQKCFCGNSFGSQGLAAPTDCDKDCPGNTNQKCGGSNLNSIYLAAYER